MPALTTYMGPLHCRTQSVYSTCRILRRMPESVGRQEVTLGGHHIVPTHLAHIPPLTQLPAPHVVQLGAQQQRGHDVDDGEDDPEGRVPLPKDLQGEQGTQ